MTARRKAPRSKLPDVRFVRTAVVEAIANECRWCLKADTGGEDGKSWLSGQSELSLQLHQCRLWGRRSTNGRFRCDFCQRTNDYFKPLAAIGSICIKVGVCSG